MLIFFLVEFTKRTSMNELLRAIHWKTFTLCVAFFYVIQWFRMLDAFIFCLLICEDLWGSSVSLSIIYSLCSSDILKHACLLPVCFGIIWKFENFSNHVCMLEKYIEPYHFPSEHLVKVGKWGKIPFINIKLLRRRCTTERWYSLKHDLV